MNSILALLTSSVMMVMIGLANTLHPALFSCLIVILSIIVSVILSSLVQMWAMLALLLIFLGGMMVIFLYVTTLASDDKVTFVRPLKKDLILTGGLFISTVSVFLLNESTVYSQAMFLGSLYNGTSGPFLSLLTLYLLIALLAVVKLSEAHKGTLKSWL